ncbi:hypothetical protein Btru_074823 [Bulinus truncatus]|nr:hypothetical protein Btru_074823 [Bulinus truncatus]
MGILIESSICCKKSTPPSTSFAFVSRRAHEFKGSPLRAHIEMPHANIYALVNPIRITLDFLTLLWSNVFLLTLTNSLDMDLSEQKPSEHIDIKMELLMPRVIIPAEEKVEGQPDRPEAVQIQVSKLVVSNCRLEEKMTRSDLKMLLDEYKEARLFSQTDFPNDDRESSDGLIPPMLFEHALALDDPYIDKAVHTLLNFGTDPSKLSPSDSQLHLPVHLPSHRLNCNSLKRAVSSDIWSAAADQVWLEFLGVQNCKNRPAPFVEATPVTVWLCSSPCAHKPQATSVSSKVHVKTDKVIATKNVEVSCPNLGNSSGGRLPSSHGRGRESSHTRDSRDAADKLSGHHIADPRHDAANIPHHDHDGNSLPHFGKEDDRRPTRLPLSGGANEPRVNRRLSRTDSLHDSNSAIDPPLRLKQQEDHHYESQQPTAEQYSDCSRQSQQRRRDKQYHREDSRSSSSPPLEHTEKSARRRTESRERRSVERRMRHSSSSSIERGHRGHDIEGRSSAEGHISSDSFRVNGKEGMSLDEGYPSEDKLKGRETELSHTHRRHHQYSSSSSSEWAPAGPGRSRDRRNLYDLQDDDMDRKLPRDHVREDKTSPRDDVHQRSSSRDLHCRRSARDGSRESEKRYNVYERSPVRPNKREMDGIPLSRKGYSRDRDGGMSDDTSESHPQRRRRSNSRGGESESLINRLDRNNDGDSYQPRYAPDDPECRSRLGEHLRSKHSDADCDNDLFSQTSHSSLDTVSNQGVLINEQKANGSDNPAAGNRESPHDKTWAKHNQRSPPDGCKSQDDLCPGDKACGCPLEPDRKICVLTKIQGKLRAQLNHFQYLFLLRLAESFSAFQNDLSADLLSLETKASRKNKSLLKDSPQPPASIVLPIMLRELEFAVVCPYQMHQRTFSDDFSLVSPFLLGMTTGQDAVFGDEGDGTCFPQLVDSIKGQRSKDDSALKPFQSSISFKSNSSSQLENVTHLGPPLDPNQRNRVFTSGSTSLIPPGNVTVPVVTAPSSFTSTDIMSQSLNSLGKDSGIGIDRKPQRPQHSKGSANSSSRGGKAGTTDMKKAFTSAFSSLTDRLKHTMESLDDSHSIGDDAETLSIRTDTSDDDFEHMSLDDVEEVPAFYHHPPPPDMTPAGGDSYSDIGDIGDSVSMYAESSTTKGKEMVYVVLFKLDHTEVIIDNRKSQSSTKAQVAKLGSLQLGNISYEDFQARFSTVKGYIQEDITEATAQRYPIKVKICSPASDPNSLAAPDLGRMFVQAHDLSLQFKMSGLICLSDFSEDEKLPEAMPISVEVRDLLLVLEEDRPPANVTSPGSLPVNLHIQQLAIERGKDGIFYIAGLPSNTSFVYGATPPPPPPKPVYSNAVTSPIMSPDGTMALLMASQNETVLLRRQLEEVRRANRLYEHQILQWRDMQDKMAGVGGRPGAGPLQGRGGIPIGTVRKHPSFTADSLSSSPSSLNQSDRPAGPSRHQTDDVDPSRDELERENLLLVQQVARLEDDLLTVSKEKESLLQTLQLLQDELLASERKQRSRSKV